MSKGHFFIQYQHSITYILDADKKVIGNSKLHEGLIPFFGETYLRVELENKAVYKCVFPGFFSTELKVLKDGKLFLLFSLFKKGIYSYRVEYEGYLIQYNELINAQHYEIIINDDVAGHIHYHTKISKEMLSQKIGTEIIVSDVFFIPTLLFALLRMNYFGPAT